MKALINIPNDINQTLNIIKAKNNLKNKVEAISLVVSYYSENELEPELRLDFIKKIADSDKKYKLGSGFKFNKLNDVKKRYNLD
jgi:pyruvate-formate lyase-activating enzyme